MNLEMDAGDVARPYVVPLSFIIEPIYFDSSSCAFGVIVHGSSLSRPVFINTQKFSSFGPPEL